MKKEQTDSPVMRLLSIIWANTNTENGHSWTRLNQTMHQGLMMAVEAGFTFAEGDLNRLTEFRVSRWIGCYGWETFYRLAVASGNRSAWKEFERFLPRVPFVWPEAEYNNARIPRLVVGARFRWDKELVTVTSIDTNNVIACSYVWTEEEYPKQKIHKRYRITREMFAAARKSEKK